MVLGRLTGLALTQKRLFRLNWYCKDTFIREIALFVEHFGRGTRFAVTSAGDSATMNTTKLNNTLKGLGLAFVMVLGVLVFSGTSASAQNRPYVNNDPYSQNQQDDDRYNGRDRNGNQSYRFAFNKGYKDGVKQGMRDARNRSRGNSDNNGGYYGNTGGYSNNGGVLGQIFGQRNNGNNGNNDRAYKRGYEQGYREGLSRVRNNNGRRNNNGGYYGN